MDFATYRREHGSDQMTEPMCFDEDELLNELFDIFADEEGEDE